MISRKMRAHRSADRHTMPGYRVDGLSHGSLIGLTSPTSAVNDEPPRTAPGG